MDVNEFILNLPKDEHTLVSKLRDLFFETEPRFCEKPSYGVPSFSRNRRIRFIGPASAPDPVEAKVSFGFCNANFLSNVQGRLFKEGRKQVHIARFSSVNEVDENLFVKLFSKRYWYDLHFQKKSKKI
jgi:hypothetical protein